MSNIGNTIQSAIISIAVLSGLALFIWSKISRRSIKDIIKEILHG